MRVIVDRVVDSGGLVEFTCSLGSGQAVWCGAEPPAQGPCDVELDIPATLVWGSTVVTTDQPASLQRSNGAELVMVCRVMQLDELGVLTLDAAGIALVETSGQPPAEVEGKNVRLVIPSLELYPTGI